MKKYKVLSPFISFDNIYCSRNSIYEVELANLTTFELDFVEHLEQCSFIEKIPERPRTVWDLKES